LQIGRTLLECGLISTGEYDRIKKSKAEKKNQFSQQFGLQTQNVNQSSFQMHMGSANENFALSQNNNDFQPDINEHENLNNGEENERNLNKKK